MRTENLKPVHAWAEALEEGRRPVASEETLTRQQRAAEALWLGLRRTEGICAKAIGERLDFDVEDTFSEPIQKLVADGLLQRHSSRLTLTDRGLLHANTVGQTFLTYDAGSP